MLQVTLHGEIDTALLIMSWLGTSSQFKQRNEEISNGDTGHVGQIPLLCLQFLNVLQGQFWC